MNHPAKQFWNWFAQNHNAYFFLDETGEEVKEQLLDNLLFHIHQYCPHIFFELSTLNDDRKELTFTAMGNSAHFEAMEILVEEAPEIKDWIFNAFIPAAEGPFTINFEDVIFRSDEIWFLPLGDHTSDNALSVAVYIRNFEFVKESRWLMPGIFQTLYTLLGEKSFAEKIGEIEVGQLPDDPVEEGMLELTDLPRYIREKNNLLKCR